MTAPLFDVAPTLVDGTSGARAWFFEAKKTVVIQTTGDMTLAVAQFLAGPVETEARRRWPPGTAKATFIHDWRSVTRYENAARDLVIQWGRGWLKDTEKVVVHLSEKASPFIHIAAQTGAQVLRLAKMPVEVVKDLGPFLDGLN